MAMFPPPESGNFFTTKVCFDNISATTARMVVDLSDTTNWPHIHTGCILVYYVHLDFNPNATFVGDIKIGWLSSVTATSGTINVFHHTHYDSGVTSGIATTGSIDFGGDDSYLKCATGNTFVMADTGDTTFQTDANLTGPDETASYPSGNGDLVVKATRSAGNISASIMVCYTTIA